MKLPALLLLCCAAHASYVTVDLQLSTLSNLSGTGSIRFDTADYASPLVMMGLWGGTIGYVDLSTTAGATSLVEPGHIVLTGGTVVLSVFTHLDFSVVSPWSADIHGYVNVGGIYDGIKYGALRITPDPVPEPGTLPMVAISIGLMVAVAVTPSILGLRIRPMFAWYDLWIGVFVDTGKKRVYLFPVPCFGVCIEWGESER